MLLAQLAGMTRFFRQVHLLRLLLCSLTIFWTVVSAATPVEDLRIQIDARSHQLFSDMAQYADEIGCKVYVGGGFLLRMALTPDEQIASKGLGGLVDSTQDVDILVDGSLGQLDKLNHFLKRVHPEIFWDTALLRKVNLDDFTRQHTDSLSTAFLRVSATLGGSELIDLMVPDRNPSRFLKDLSDRHIHFIFSPDHEKTRYFLKGKNPSLYAVMRYLTEILAYGMDPVPEDIPVVNQLISAIDVDAHYPEPRTSKLYQKLFRNIQRTGTNYLPRFGFNMTGFNAAINGIHDPVLTTCDQTLIF